LIRILCDLGIEIVHQHPHCRFLMPAFARPLVAARRVNDSLPTHDDSVLNQNRPDEWLQQHMQYRPPALDHP
jgi:hypothetical protein